MEERFRGPRTSSVSIISPRTGHYVVIILALSTFCRGLLEDGGSACRELSTLEEKNRNTD